MSEFRQFRISQRSYDDSIEMIVGNADDLADDLHVIEYKAYSKLKEENERLKKYTISGLEIMLKDLK